MGRALASKSDVNRAQNVYIILQSRKRKYKVNIHRVIEITSYNIKYELTHFLKFPRWELQEICWWEVSSTAKMSLVCRRTDKNSCWTWKWQYRSAQLQKIVLFEWKKWGEIPDKSMDGSKMKCLCSGGKIPSVIGLSIPRRWRAFFCSLPNSPSAVVPVPPHVGHA